MSKYMLEKKNTDKLFTVFAMAVLCAAGVFLLWKCRFGFANVDESFYLTIPMRLMQGDALFRDEWHLSQTSGVLLLPFMQLFRLLHTDNQGIMLWFRYLFVCAHWLTAIFVFLRLRRIDQAGALVSALGLMIYAPYGVSALSYNSMGIIAMVLYAVILLTAKEHRRLQYFLCGVFLAAGVLCCPYLVLAYVALTAAVIYNKFRKRSTAESVYTPELWLFVTAGAGLCAAVFMIYALSRASVSEICSAVSYILADPEHEPRSIFTICRTYAYAIFCCTGKVSALCVSALAMLAAAAYADRRRRFSSLLFLAAVVFTALYELGLIAVIGYINFLMLSVNLLAPVCVLIVSDEQIKKIFSCIWVPGMIYSFCIHCSSNQKLFAISSASSVAFVGSIIIIILAARMVYAGERRRVIRAAIICCVSALLCLQIGSELVYRYKSVFWENSMAEQTCKITHGTEKGLLVTPEKLDIYETSLAVLAGIPEYQKAESVAFISERTWLYLQDGKRMGSYSAWLSGVNKNSVARLVSYYQLNPDKLPEVILVERGYEEASIFLSNMYGYNMRSTELWDVLSLGTEK